MEKIPVRQIREPDFSESFNIRDIGVLLSGKDMVQGLHRHNFFFILVLEKGRGEHIIDFIPYPISDYTIFLMRPGQVHQLTLNKESTGYLMEFNLDFYSSRDKTANQLLRKAGNKNYCQLDFERFKKLLSILTYIHQEYDEKQEKYKEVIRANLEIFFIELVRQTRNSDSLLGNNNQYSRERLDELLELLETHISTNKQVAQYAEMMHLSPFQLNAITKENLGKNFSELINEHIILEAKRLLLATSNQINEIADQLGYEDVSYFIRYFKRHTGYSPEAFRQNFK